MGVLRWGAAALILATTIGGNGGCRGGSPPPREETASMTRRPLDQVLATHTPRLMALPGVVGTYEGATRAGAPCIRVMVVKTTPALRDSIPSELEGWPVEIEETGEIRPL